MKGRFGGYWMGLRIDYKLIDNKVVGVCSLKGKKKLNLLDDHILETAASDLQDLIASEPVRCIIIQGSCPYAFSGGVDLNQLGRLTKNTAKSFISKLHTFCNMIRELPVPVIAKIQGFCIGGGLEIAAACDFRIGDYTVMCGMPEVKVGVPSVIEANLLLGLIGWGKARELMLRGNMIDAEECSKIGLLQHLIKTDLLSSFIDDICKEIVANGANALRLQKQLLLEWERAMSSNSIAASIGYFQENFESEECSGLTKEFFKKKITD